MIEKRVSLGINVSILLILMIFGVLLSLPLRLLFDTKYYNWNTGNKDSVTNPKNEGKSALIIDHRKLKCCPNLPYESRLISVFLNDYDGNCTYIRNKCGHDSGSEERENDKRYKSRCRSKSDVVNEDNTEEILKERQMKSVTVAGYILVTMLLVSVIAAFVEVLRIRFTTEKDSSRAGMTISRQSSSTVDSPAANPPISRELIRSKRLFEIRGMHQSALRLLSAHSSPLIRQSSFPTSQVKQAATSSLCNTPTNRMSRRQSLESDEEIRIVSSNALHHRVRLIRRH